jgi:SAM-dependent methyltransferase
VPDRPAADLEALSDLCTPWSIHVVATLRIAEQIAAGIDEIQALASQANCDARMLRSVLRHLVSKGVFEEPAPGRFALNDAARGLLDPGLHLVLDLDGLGGRFAHAWGTLLDVVRTGQPAYRERFGRPFWEDLDAHPDLGASFDQLMGAVGHGTPDPDVLLNRDWDSVRTVVDVGGGTGGMLAEVLRAHSHVRGTLVDVSGPVERSAEIFGAAGVADRVTTLPGSFFEPLPPGADLYLLIKVLNDWPDRETLAILRRCAEAARPNGRIVVSGGVSPDDTRDGLSHETVLLGGRSQNLAEFREMAQLAGLEIVASGRQPSGRFLLECRPI